MPVTITIPNEIGAEAGPNVAASKFDENWDSIKDTINADLVLTGAESVGALNMTGTRRWAKGTDISSVGGTLTIPSNGNYFDVTGTTTITAISSLQAGTVVMFQFDSALIMTHNATTLILIDGRNFTTRAGSIMMFVSEGSGNWRELPVWRMPASVSMLGNRNAGGEYIQRSTVTIAGGGAAPSVAQAVSFAVSFTTTPIVFITSQNNAGGSELNIGTWRAHTVTTSGFTAVVASNDGATNLAAVDYIGAWLAIGT